MALFKSSRVMDVSMSNHINEHWVLLRPLLYHSRVADVFFHWFIASGEIIILSILSRITFLIFPILDLDGFIKWPGNFLEIHFSGLMVIYASVSSSKGTLSAVRSFSIISFDVKFIFSIFLLINFVLVLQVIFSLRRFLYWSFLVCTNL